MKTVFKYPIDLRKDNALELPIGAEVRLFAEDPQGQICIWFEIDTDEKKTERKFRIYGTGHPMVNKWEIHLGSIVSGQFVWHLYEIEV